MQNPQAFRHFQGKSGKVYLYGQVHLNHVSPHLTVAGIFIFAKDKDTDIDIIYIGESTHIYDVITTPGVWDTAKLTYQADLIFARPEADPAARNAEKRDLEAQWKPPMKWRS